MTARGAEDLHVLSAGAAQGLVEALAPRYLVETGVALRTTFGAVGAIRDKLLAGDRCDVLILTEAMIDQLTASGHVVAATRAALGRVRTGIGVRTGDALPDITSEQALERSLRAATDIFLPDPQRATAGIHFVRVLQQLEIYAEMAPRLRPLPEWRDSNARDGAKHASRPIGCTQITEIKYTEGVTLVGPLPHEFELATVYSVAVCADASQPELARRFVRLLSGSQNAGVRADAGFDA